MPSDSIHVLLIEDEPDVARLVRTALSQHSTPRFEVQSAGTLAEGLRLLGEAVFDAAVLDLGLPDSRGAATVEAVRARFPLLPIVVLSATGDEETIHAAMRAGAQDYILKGPAVVDLLPRSILFAVDHKRAEEALRQSEARFRALTENSSDVILVVDRKGTITYVSPSVERFLGYKTEELLGKSSFDYIVPADPLRARYDFVSAILTKGGAIPNAFLVRHQDGSERILEGVGKSLFYDPAVAGFLMNVRDITERERALEALRQSEEKFRIVGEFTHDWEYWIGPDGRMLYMSPSCERITGYRAEEFSSDPALLMRIVHPDDRDQVAMRLDGRQSQGENGFS